MALAISHCLWRSELGTSPGSTYAPASGYSEKVVSLVQADPAVLKRLVGNAKVNGLAQKALVSSMLATTVVISSYCERSNITGLTPPAEPLRRERSAVRCMVRS